MFVGLPGQVMSGIVVVCIAGVAAWGQSLPAFPTAEGFGAAAAGGRGGAVYHVTNLDDTGPGSLRYGIEQAAGPTTIVFDVGGTIHLQSSLGIPRSFLTIAGQTAPGDGIAVVGHSTLIGAGATDIVIRYMRFRAGDISLAAGAQDSLSIFDAQRIVIDHVSTSWGLDESLSVTRSNNVTVQYCIIAETLNPARHAYGSLVRGHVDAAHSGGYTFHHNLWIHNNRRNPALGSYQEVDKDADLEAELINNVICNWGARSIHTVRSRAALRINLVNNLLIAGPDTQTAEEVLRVEAFTGNVQVHQSGNLIDGDKDAAHNPVGVTPSMFRTGLFAGLTLVNDPFPFPGIFRVRDASEAYAVVLTRVGASLRRDAADQRLIQDLISRGGGIIVSQNQVGGFPTLAGGPAPLDSDRDGMPDAWELRWGLDPHDPTDGNVTASNGYTNLENYLNSLTGEVTMPVEP